MGKIALQIKNAPDGIGAKQLFDNKKDMDDALKAWEDSGKMTKINIKGSALSFETNQGTTPDLTRGSGVIKEVADDFVFEEESQD